MGGLRHPALLSVVCAACIVHRSQAISTLPASAFTPTAPSRSSLLRLRGGAPASTSPTMFPWGSKNSEPKFLPMPVAPAEELIASRISGADFIESALMAGGGWRLVLGGSFILFFIATSIPGRLDMKLGKPKKEDMRFFTPSPWAFAIWGPIFLGEMAMAITTAVAPGALSGPAGDRWLMEMAPSYAAAALHQVLWTGAFREWALDKLWISASLLTFAAVGLFSAHGTITRALSIPGHVSTWGYIAAALPVSMHFGWMTCAAALSWNNVLNKFGAPAKVQLSAAIATCYGAAALLGHVSFWGKDPVPALVGAWALWAVSTGHEVLRGAVDNLSLDTLNFTAKCTSVMSAVAAVATMVRRFAF